MHANTDPTPDQTAMRDMFNCIARRYDLLNHLLSFGLDFYWRRQAVRLVNFRFNRRVLDIGTGTGDMALQAAKNGADKIIGLDPSPAMLEKAKAKFHKREWDALFRPVCGFAETLPLDDASIDVVLCAFSLRNVSDLRRTVEEMLRVLSPVGVAVILEFSQPRLPVFRQLFQWYFHHLLPRLGAWISGHRNAYRYLPESVSRFPSGQHFCQYLLDCGFTDVRSYPMSGGIVTVYAAMK